MKQQVVAALVGLLIGAVGAWVKAALAIREKVNEELRSRRIGAYPIAFRLTAALSHWPPARMNCEELFCLNLALREWYFTVGGLYLSENARDRYGNMKQLISAHLEELPEESNRATQDVPRSVYDDLTKTASAFRNALTEDLETRRQRSLLWVAVRWQRHRRDRKNWEHLRKKLKDPQRQITPYPLKQMPLPPVRRPCVAVEDRCQISDHVTEEES